MPRTKNILYAGTRRFIALATLAVVLACLPLALQATNPLVGVDWFERQIGDGIVWRQYEFDSLFGVRQNINYFEADLDNPSVVVEFPYLATGLQKTTVMTPNQFPAALAAVNGTYFNSSEQGHNTYLRINSTVVPHKTRTKGLWGHHGGFAKNASGWSVLEIPGTTADSWENNTTHPTIMANGPILVWEGEVAQSHIDKITVGNTHCTSRRSRTAVGLTDDNKLILLTVDERADRGTGVSCVEAAQILLWLGVVEALNMDGGGTTTAYVKNEPNSGLVNYPSDSSGNERVTANTIALVSPPAAPAAWDAQLLSFSYTATVQPNQTQTVTLTYKNIGTQTWTKADTKLVTSRPTGRSSELHQVSWVSPSQPALMTQDTVAPGSNATFSFQVTAPDTTSAESYTEHFMLTQEGIGRIGPSDSLARMRILVLPDEPVGDTFLIETRSNGKNFAWYSDPNFADSGAVCSAPGVTAGIQTRYTSTFRSSVGLRTATYRPNFPVSGDYHVSVTWAAMTARRNPITYHVDHNGGRDTFLIDQSASANTWIPLGIFSFTEGQSDSGRVQMTNEDIDMSGNMNAGPVRFVRLETSVPDWCLFQ